MGIKTYKEWCIKYGCNHGHCGRYECENPQPFIIENERLICGRCAILENTISDMVPCTPETCIE